MIDCRDRMPTHGQFVALWMYNDSIFSATLRWEGDNLLEYKEEHDSWVEIREDDFDLCFCNGARFVLEVAI